MYYYNYVTQGKQLKPIIIDMYVCVHDINNNNSKQTLWYQLGLFLRGRNFKKVVPTTLQNPKPKGGRIEVGKIRVNSGVRRVGPGGPLRGGTGQYIFCKHQTSSHPRSG